MNHFELFGLPLQFQLDGSFLLLSLETCSVNFTQTTLLLPPSVIVC